MKTLILTLSLLVPTVALAQEAPKVEPPTNGAITFPESAKEHLTRLDILIQMESLIQEVNQWRQMYAQMSQRVTELEITMQRSLNQQFVKQIVQEVETANPGFTLDLKTRQIVPLPKPKE